MHQTDDIRFLSSTINLPSFSPPPGRQSHSFSSSYCCNFARLPFNFCFNNHIPQCVRNRPFFRRIFQNRPLDAGFNKPHIFCSSALALVDTKPAESRDDVIRYQGNHSGAVTQPKVSEEERVLISEVLVRNKDGEELQRKDLEAEAFNALKASRANSALTVSEVQEDVHRIIASGYFMSCLPIAVDTRDGINLIFQVEPTEDFQGLVCEGANVLPAKFVEDTFRDGYGKTVNIRHLDRVVSSINSWYMEHSLFGMVSGVEILSGGIIKLQILEAEVNKISIRFLDRNGEPAVGKTKPETILRELTTNKGQVYSAIQGKKDADTILAMGCMDDVNIIPQPSDDSGKVDLTLNVVEPKIDVGISVGGGMPMGTSSGTLARLIGSIAVYHKNLFGRNQKLNLSLERGQIDSVFRIHYTDPWIEGDDKRTSRIVMVQNSRTSGTFVHSNQPDNSVLTIGRFMAGIEYSRPYLPKWNGTTGLMFQRVGASDERGNPIIKDFFGSPLTASGNSHDDMLLAKIGTVYSSSGKPGSSMFVFNLDQAIPVSREWLAFSRVNAHARQGFVVGPATFLIRLSGGHMVGKFPPLEVFPIGGTNCVRGYEEGEVGSGCSYAVGSGEILFPLIGPVEGAIFVDYGTDLGSGASVPGNPAGVRNKPGSGYGYGIGMRVNSPYGPLRLEYAFNDQHTARFHFGIGRQS